MKGLFIFWLLLAGHTGWLAASTSEEAALRALVAQWSPALNEGKPELLTRQFAEGRPLSVTTAGGKTLLSIAEVEAFLRTDPAARGKGRTHSFSVQNIRFPAADVAVLFIRHGIAGGSARVDGTMTGVLRKLDGRWRWIALWPFLAAEGPRVKREDMDGSRWTVSESGDELVFENGRFFSVSAVRQGYYPAPYAARRVNDTIVWSAELRSFKAESSVWYGEAAGDHMKGSVSHDEYVGRESSARFLSAVRIRQHGDKQ
jgi:hypothetical protein